MDETDANVVLNGGSSRVVLHPVQSGWHGEYRFEHQIDVVGGPFRGSISAAAYADPYPRFHNELTNLYRTLSGTATLGYENFKMTLTGDGRGHIEVDVVATGDHFRAEHLSFRMELDQTQLPDILAAISRTFLDGSTTQTSSH